MLGHEDLAANVGRVPLEIPGNGIDDDGNGYVVRRPAGAGCFASLGAASSAAGGSSGGGAAWLAGLLPLRALQQWTRAASPCTLAPAVGRRPRLGL